VSDVDFFAGTSMSGSLADVDADATVAKINKQKEIKDFMDRGGEQQIALS